MPELKQITYPQLANLRFQQWEKQNKICPILKQKIEYKDAVIDHKHITKKEIQESKLGKDGKGLLRGSLHRQANSWEGKVTNAFKRYGLHKLNISLPEALRNLADYIENPPMEQKYIHPNEKPRPEKIGKRQYNKICKHYFKMYPKRKKLPKYPKNGRITKELKKLLKIVNNIV